MPAELVGALLSGCRFRGLPRLPRDRGEAAQQYHFFLQRAHAAAQRLLAPPRAGTAFAY